MGTNSPRYPLRLVNFSSYFLGNLLQPLMSQLSNFDGFQLSRLTLTITYAIIVINKLEGTFIRGRNLMRRKIYFMTEITLPPEVGL